MSEIEVVIPTSPIPIHPSTEIIKRVVASVRYHLPDSIIHILADGVRPEVEHRRKQYEEYLAELEDWCSNPGSGIYLTSFEAHKQQAGMLRYLLPELHCKNLLFIEHDATLDEKPIPWDIFCAMLDSGAANTIRLYWHEGIHPEHTHLMVGSAGDFVQTIQWSGWPFIGRTDFYRELMERFFAHDDCKMLETTLYSPVAESPWEEFKTVIYCPQPDAVRFHHLNGRVDPVTGQKDPGSW